MIFFRFFTDKEIFQELYECAKSEKKEITDFSILLNSKLQLLQQAMWILRRANLTFN